MKSPALLAEDGATFHGRIQAIEAEVEGREKQFRASCYAQLDMKSHVDVEMSDMQLFNTEEKARAWIHGKAAARGFSKVHLPK